jgi:hypothetical protein
MGFMENLGLQVSPLKYEKLPARLKKEFMPAWGGEDHES